LKYVDAKMNSDIRDWNYRHYVANSLMMIPEGKHYISSLYDLMNDNASRQPQETGEEIVDRVVANAGITILE